VPELPEVETVVREVRPLVLGRRVQAVSVGHQPLRRPWSEEWSLGLPGRRILDVRRRGKWIIIALSGNRYLLVHLGMTGQLTVVPSVDPMADHTHLIFCLRPGRVDLRFRDVRRFGCALLFTGAPALDAFFEEAGLGPEPFDVRQSVWYSNFVATRRCLKAVLLDQRVVAGIGNIYADESLFHAGLHPARVGSELSRKEADRLRRAVTQVLRHAIRCRGSSIRNYVGGLGLRGAYQEEFRVYQQAGRPCPRCGELICRVRLAGRSTHFCPQCQPLRTRTER
jgi:formamidopyrimidine-DNA glycosylase